MKLKSIKRKADRAAAIQYLCQKDFEFINEGDGAGLELLDSILENGFKGYINYTDRELNDAIAERKEMERMGI
jgi:primase-polymerase (primpol)-like protein